MPCLFPAIAALVEEHSHKLGDSKCGVSVIDVDSNLLMEVVESAVNAHVLVYDITDRCCAKEVLLSESEALALCVVIVRIENLGDSL